MKVKILFIFKGLSVAEYSVKHEKASLKNVRYCFMLGLLVNLAFFKGGTFLNQEEKNNPF